MIRALARFFGVNVFDGISSNAGTNAASAGNIAAVNSTVVHISGVPLGPEAMQAIIEAANNWKKGTGSESPIEDLSTVLSAELRKQAQLLVERGHLVDASSILRKAEASDVAAEQKLMAEIFSVRISRAITLVQAAGVAELDFRYDEAALLYRAAAEMLPDFEVSRRAEYITRAARALLRENCAASTRAYSRGMLGPAEQKKPLERRRANEEPKC